MTTKQPNPFMDFDMTKFDLTKMVGDFKVPGMDVEGLLAAQRRNVEAVTAANQLALEGLQAVARRQVEIVRGTMEEAASMMTQMMAAGTPEDKIAKQADLVKAAFEKALSNVKEIAEMVAKANGEAATVINKRVSESLEEVKGLLKQQQAANGAAKK
ncbi:MAG TPA: phasin family protein [Alphaproteobacteria bacterium]|nr:phasin family protein [Alphaproteobacteria bacterium]